MRYEAKHHYFKKLSTVIGNYTNLPYTLSMRHQQWVCYQLQSGNHELSFINKGLEIGSGTILPINCTVHNIVDIHVYTVVI